MVLDGQNACKGVATSASIFRHTLGELDAALDGHGLREAWTGDPPSNGVSCVCSRRVALVFGRREAGTVGGVWGLGGGAAAAPSH